MTDLDTQRSTASSRFEVLSHFVRWQRSAVLRGGRMTKFKGQAASYSPELGLIDTGDARDISPSSFGVMRNILRWTAAPLAFAAATTAQAQDACIQPDPVNQPDVWVCEDNGSPATTPQFVSGTVLLEDGFETAVTGGPAGGLGVGAGSDGNLTVTQVSGTSTIAGERSGITALNAGSGILLLAVRNVEAPDGIAINADNYGTDLSIRTSGTVSGRVGINAFNGGSGILSVTTNAVEATFSYGIFAYNRGTDLTIDSTGGDVQGVYFGVGALNFGSGAIAIATSGVVADARSGILARNYGTGLTISSSAGTVSGGEYGILAENYGSGPLRITAGEVSGGNIGIRSRGATSATLIELSSGEEINGTAAQGIWASSTGAAAHITIDGMGANASGGTDGLDLDTNGAHISVSNFASITGNAGDGIDVISSGGDITITDIGTITGTDGNGILASSFEGDISIQGVGLDGGVSGTGLVPSSIPTFPGGAPVRLPGSSGIVAITSGGAINIGGERAIGSVAGTGAAGIYASNWNSSSDAPITIDTTGEADTLVTGDFAGIVARNRGSGGISITTANVVSASGNGIIAESGRGSVWIDTTAGESVVGATRGIFALTGSLGGDITVTTANVTGGSSAGMGITSFAGEVAIDSTAGEVRGGTYGIVARTLGDGGLIIAADDVTGGTVGIRAASIDGAITIDLAEGAEIAGTAEQGIWASSTGSAAHITIDGMGANASGGTDGLDIDTNGATISVSTFASITGNAGDGIDAISTGGDITITDIGTITGTYGAGILAASYDGDISIQGVGLVGGVTGTGSGAIRVNINPTTQSSDLPRGSGIIAVTDGGDINIGGTTAIGDVRSAYGTGILALSSGGDITIDSTARRDTSVYGTIVGIYAGSTGASAISITSGDVTANGPGITAKGGAGGVSIDSTGGTVSGGVIGISASASGAGDVSVRSAGTYAIVGSGIVVTTTDGNIAIDTSLGPVSGYLGGIAAASYGGGDIEVTSANVTGRSRDAIALFNTAAGGDMRVTSSGLLRASDTYGDAVDARNNSATGSVAISIESATTYGTQGYGINASTNVGTIDISSTGQITTKGAGSWGVNAVTNSGTITARLNDVTADGVFAHAVRLVSRSGDIDLTSTGTIRTNGGSLFQKGILATSISGDISIDANNVSVRGDNNEGIFATSVSGDVLVSAVNVSSNGIDAEAIDARSDVGTVRVATSGQVSANGFESDGIYARSTLGSIFVTASDVTTNGTAAEAIRAGSDAGDVNIITNGIIITTGASAADGVDATSQSGFIDIDGTGSITTSGTYSPGIYAKNQTGSIEIEWNGPIRTSGDFSNGIYGYTQAGSIAIAANGSVDAQGDNARGILALAGGSVSITGNAAISTQGAGAHGIWGQSSNGAVSIASNGSINASGAGADGILARTGGAGKTVQVNSNLVTGETGIRTVALDGDTTITVSSTAVVTGTVGSAIHATSIGGAIVARGSSGVFVGATDGVYSNSMGGDITVDTIGSVTGLAGDGLDLRSGGGDILVTNVGTIAGTGGNGILANAGTGNISIQGSGLVGGIAGSENGIVALTSGSIDIGGSSANGLITGENDAGIYSRSGAGLVINTVPSAVSGGTFGINALNNGSYGSLSITTAGVTGSAQDAIYAVNQGEDLTIDSSAGAVEGGRNGIFARNLGSGALSIASAGVEGLSATGIVALNEGTRLSIDTSTGTVQGQGSGISARNPGSGDLSITTAMVTSETGNGIEAQNTNGGDLLIDTRLGSVSAEQYGILATSFGAGNIAISTANVRSASLDGILAFGDNTDIAVDTRSGNIIGASSGITAFASYAGDVSVVASHVESTVGVGINATSGGGNIIVDSTNGTVLADTAGIFARANGPGAVSITSADVRAANGVGIFGLAVDGSVMVDSSMGSVSGGTAGIALQVSGTGSVAVTAGDVIGEDIGIRTRAKDGTTTIRLGSAALVAGQNGTGIDAASTGAAASIALQGMSDSSVSGTDGVKLNTVGAEIVVRNLGSVTGRTGNGIEALSDGGNIAITGVGTIVGTGGSGIFVDAGTGAISIQDSGLVGGITGSDSGIVALTGGALDIGGSSANGRIAGEQAAGIFARAGAGLVINTVPSAVSGGTSGISAMNNGDIGSLSITTAGVTGTAQDAIYAVNQGEDLTIDSSAGAVEGGRNGIFARNEGSGALSIVAGKTTGAMARAIWAANFGTDLTIDSSAGTVTGASDGISAFNAGSGRLAVTTGSVQGTSYFSSGINAVNYGTDLTVDTRAGAVSGDRSAIRARNSGTGALSIITGHASASITSVVYGSNFGSDTTIDTSAGVIARGQYGIFARHNGAGRLAIVTGDVIGASGTAIAATSVTGTDLTISTVAGTVSGGTSGIVASSFGSGDLVIATADVIGLGDRGISAVHRGRDLTVDSSEGTVTGAQTGIEASNYGAEGVLSIVTGSVVGTKGNGITAVNFGSDLIINTVAGEVRGGNFGIVANHFGTGSLSVTTGNVTGESESQSRGIYARNQGSDLRIDSTGGEVIAEGDGIAAVQNGTGQLSITTGDVASRSANGIVALSNDGGDIAITSNGTVTGASTAILLSNVGGGATSIVNTGTLFGGTTTIYAFTDNAGDIAIDNSGTIAGSVTLGIGDDALTNRGGGLFLATADSEFGDGTDLFTNLGIFALDGHVALHGLEQFDNSSLVTMVDGFADDSLTLPGNYLAGSELALDVDFASGTADMLIIGGQATGTTTVFLNQTSAPTAFGQRILLVDAGAGTAQSAFELAPASQNRSAFQTLAIDFDATAGDFSLYKAITPRVFEATKLAEAGQSLWYRSADAWSDHRANLRFTGEEEPLWLTFYAAAADRDETYADPTGFATGSAVLDYEQDFFGLQTGVEFLGSETFGLGLTAGYLSSRAKLTGRGNAAAFDVFNVGASATYKSGGFFADALIKYDFISGSLSDRAQGGFTGNLDGKAFGGRVDLGYRIGDEAFYIQPQASIEFQNSDLDDLVINAQRFEFDSTDAVRGIAGVRIGGQRGRSNGAALGYYIDASAVHEFEGRTTVRFVAQSDVASFANNPIDTYAHIEAGLKLHGRGPISGFFQIESDLSDNYTSLGGRAGIRLAF